MGTDVNPVALVLDCARQTANLVKFLKQDWLDVCSFEKFKRSSEPGWSSSYNYCGFPRHR
jgi:hypothetical protein